MLHKFLEPRISPNYIDQYEADYAKKLVTLKEIRMEISKESVLE
jgi:hypothetical protein